MFNTTKALLAIAVVLIVLAIVCGTWIATPQHSGVAMSVGLVALGFGGVFIGWIYDTPPAY